MDKNEEEALDNGDEDAVQDSQPGEAQDQEQSGETGAEEDRENPRTANARIRELAADKNVAVAETGVKDAQVRSLQDKIQNYGQFDASQPAANVGMPEVKPGEDISPEQYRDHVMRSADAIVELKLQQRDNFNRIKTELMDSVTEYPDLNPKNKETFNPDLSEAITGAVEAFVKANPTGNVKKYIDSLMKPYQRSVQKGVADQTQQVAKQVNETAMRPSGSPKGGEKPFKDLSLEEMEARLGKVS